ncbi:hypothetical protein E2C01_056566 [Portunus trituberculatus]|uniref:Uncharacterized protein n=1 Tax=Portunus trituberculatus TaxID=210409 RepID=A0A5B7GQP0_PORTR|nr:hypothetical protein [Portunus trituberculatus]
MDLLDPREKQDEKERGSGRRGIIDEGEGRRLDLAATYPECGGGPCTCGRSAVVVLMLVGLTQLILIHN